MSSQPWHGDAALSLHTLENTHQRYAKDTRTARLAKAHPTLTNLADLSQDRDSVGLTGKQLSLPSGLTPDRKWRWRGPLDSTAESFRFIAEARLTLAYVFSYFKGGVVACSRFGRGRYICCSKNIGMLKASGALLLLACAPAAVAHNGYSLSRTGGGQFTGTKVPLLDPADLEIAKFASGVSVTLWVRFNDLTPSRIQIPLAINTEFQDNLFQAFGGMHGGFFFGGTGPSAVADLPGDTAKDWHHYAFTWDDANSGDVVVYVDGKVHSTQSQKLENSAGDKVNWWEKNAYIIVGASGYYPKCALRSGREGLGWGG